MYERSLRLLGTLLACKAGVGHIKLVTISAPIGGQLEAMKKTAEENFLNRNFKDFRWVEIREGLYTKAMLMGIPPESLDGGLACGRTGGRGGKAARQDDE